jgi:adenylate kinase
MKNIVFIAPPAAGKGTLSDLLVNKYEYKHISTGDLLRSEVASSSALGLKISEIIKSGELVSDEIVNELLINTLKNIDKPFILDGYPRTLEQVHFLDEILTKVNKEIGAVIYLDVNEEVATKRATGRIICPNCNKTYHKFYKKPLNEGICDVCNNKLISRSDDTEETFKVRYQTYLKNIQKILDIYQERNILNIIDALDADTAFEEIEKVIK